MKSKIYTYALFGFIIAGLLFCAVYLSLTSSVPEKTKDGRVIVTYWEKWGSFEYDTMQSIIDEFNASQDKIFVKYLQVSEINTKVLLATTGGNPPDLAGIWEADINNFATKSALTPLNKFLEEAGMSKKDFLPVIWNFCERYGYVWALPTTPYEWALYRNKRLFREAGLDSNKIPETIEELDKMSEQLTIVKIKRVGKYVKVRYTELTPKEKKDKNFELEQIGYSPSIPGDWNQYWIYWFGGKLWNGKDKITALNEGNKKALAWYKSYADKYGVKNLESFKSGSGNWGTAMAPFFTEKVAMEINGSWYYSFIKNFNPGMDWDVCPFPAEEYSPGAPTTVVGFDCIVIPSGAKHPREAFEFMKFLTSQKQMEKLNIGHLKFSPRSEVTQDFLNKHPNPQIKFFIDLAKSPNAHSIPTVPIWNEYLNEMLVVYQQVFDGNYTVEEGLQNVQNRMDWKMERFMERWNKVKEERIKQWSKENDSL